MLALYEPYYEQGIVHKYDWDEIAGFNKVWEILYIISTVLCSL